ncbi:SDR family oxidoreductase [Fictibacillus enclensis]|uniref:SDR family oxidoreductase n=1 Tax=Fictibacillus enclensis TaxID=1017270 RepID=UPI0024C04CB5|nr:SDR family oxidoreductase [Fictibacillus enclensis]WHY75098.1 SDR family oxidoreductase [Fictibacillus enclensis]
MAISLKKLKHQVVVITGASSGIGLATARMAASKGAKVVLAARNEAALQQLAEELRGKGCPAAYVVADVGKEEDVRKISDTALSEFGRFDTWVNNAGVSIFGKAMDVSTEDMKRMFETNFWGVVYGSRMAVKHFTERGVPGALINVGSLFGDRGAVVQSTYSAAKFALHGWTENLRMELEKDKAPVSVTLIHPGRIDTPYNEHAMSYLDKQPAHIGMMYAPEAVADAILYAASHPTRDMFVGSQAKLTAVLGRLAPRMMDKWMEATMFRTQHDNGPSNTREESGLYHPGYGMHERGTNTGWVRNRSWYVKASKHPVLSAMALTGLGMYVWNMSKNHKKEQVPYS